VFVAQLESEAGHFTVGDALTSISDKLVRRHPHVFASGPASDAAEVNEAWERQKIAEKGRTSAVDGIPVAQPALALAGALLSRAARAGLDVQPRSGDEIGERLFAVVRDAVAAGVDAESALRRTARAYRAAIEQAEGEAIEQAEGAAIEQLERGD
jgi:XTP/dITP diphosphohydrolase